MTGLKRFTPNWIRNAVVGVGNSRGVEGFTDLRSLPIYLHGENIEAPYLIEINCWLYARGEFENKKIKGDSTKGELIYTPYVKEDNNKLWSGIVSSVKKLFP